MSHRLSTPGLKESSTRSLKGPDKPCCSQIGKQRPREGSHLPKVTEQVETPYTYIFRLPQCSLMDLKKKWRLSKWSLYVRPGSQSFVFGGATSYRKRSLNRVKVQSVKTKSPSRPQSLGSRFLVSLPRPVLRPISCVSLHG